MYCWGFEERTYSLHGLSSSVTFWVSRRGLQTLKPLTTLKKSHSFNHVNKANILVEMKANPLLAWLAMESSSNYFQMTILSFDLWISLFLWNFLLDQELIGMDCIGKLHKHLMVFEIKTKKRNFILFKSNIDEKMSFELL